MAESLLERDLPLKKSLERDLLLKKFLQEMAESLLERDLPLKKSLQEISECFARIFSTFCTRNTSSRNTRSSWCMW